MLQDVASQRSVSVLWDVFLYVGSLLSAFQKDVFRLPITV